MSRLKPDARRTVADLIERNARIHAQRPCILYRDQRLSYEELNARANRVAHWGRQLGLGRGDVVALLMANRPEYLVTWAGLAKLGVVTALINTHLSGRSLRHALATSNAKRLILGAELCENFMSLESAQLFEGPLFVSSEAGAALDPAGLPAGAENFDAAISGFPMTNPDPGSRDELRCGDDLFYIYTSGTTGPPKAARFSHLRFLMSTPLGGLVGYRPGDVLYCALPLYHSAGGAAAVASAWGQGAALAIRPRFSASQFWDDIRHYDATAFQYIGEFCRYLLNQPPGPRDREHRVRLAVGNGLRPDIWEEFRDRFGIRRILEFYGATEGNVGLVNFSGHPGSVGRIPSGLFSSARLIAYDVEQETHPRNARGYCIECKPDEVGELVSRIPRKAGRARFEGYTSAAETEKKILRNVFREGDAYFRTGDLLRRDRKGFFYFVDRIGDTFRWKGENVSTQEVAEHLGGFAGVELVNVYGVRLPGADGSAGMAGLVLSAPERFDGRAFYAFAREGLPAYAAPVFLRLLPQADLTGTFKLRKLDLQAEGFDPDIVQDPLFVRDEAAQSYVPLSPERFARIRSGAARL